MSDEEPLVKSVVALPEREYLARIGELAYSVSSLEWTLLGDLRRLAVDLPNEVSLADLEWRSTGGIALRIEKHALGMSAGPIKDYLLVAADAFKAVSLLRNDLLHARPATDSMGRQRLNRAQTNDKRTTGHRFWIDEAWLNTAMTEANQHIRAVNTARPPFA
ncbi:hypothetical protein ACHABQ_05485 [Nesterenkonia aurantiaca]|uniref:hypothetical protein n=1 Tax=Nesterenkonia aurantiaca TaxID=1436010 RepID=UPI003EE5ABD4